MWLITSFIAALIVTAIWIFAPKKYQLSFLGLMLWGLTTMVLIDHILGYEGGAFVEMETHGLITNGIVLGIVMLIPIFLIWELSLIHNKMKGKITTR
ncbi:MAG: hypothetical protein KKC68_08835 [Candidatus Thermoplasmatota archaeon]|nr:hypothetical protein [Candidatus Thermoplasmatota archaeon]MBU1941865.1 hypothetical protein [Candidatus Thermoplasmatota archaeon]